jgi:predicted nucleotidyltransferase component of viral defense system
MLQRFVLERFLYRLGRSQYRDQFVLKGALMLAAWNAPWSRPTRDIDLLGRLNNDVEHITSAIKEICTQAAEEDGLRFDASSVTGERIVEAADYAGVRVRLTAYLGKARIPVQIDIGFGDPVVPAPVPVRLPTVLDLPPTELQGYSRESALAEKLQAMVVLGALNSRMKDFYDVWLLANHFDFEGATLSRAIHATFHRRRTAVSPTPVAFTDGFGGSPDKQTQWAAFLRRQGIQGAPSTLLAIVRSIAEFLDPILCALGMAKAFEGRWPAGGPWA